MTIYQIDELFAVQTQRPDGSWVLKRPINWQCRSILQRFREAWAVFTGKADAVSWKDED